MQTATVMTGENGEIVQLPAGFQMGVGEVFDKRVGRSVVLIPKDTDLWQVMADSLGEFTDDFMQDRCQPAEQSREAIFELGRLS